MDGIQMAVHTVCILEVFEIKNGSGELLLTGKSGVLLIEITQIAAIICFDFLRKLTLDCKFNEEQGNKWLFWG